MKLFTTTFFRTTVPTHRNRLNQPFLRYAQQTSFSTSSKFPSKVCRSAVSLLEDYTYFEKYFKQFCQKNQMDPIDYSKLAQNEDLIVQTVWTILRKEAEAVIKKEELMKPLVEEAILQHSHFKDALSYRLATKLGGHLIPVTQWIKIFQEAYNIKQDNASYDLENAACLDLVAVKDRDPACDTLFTAFMFFKGYKALQIYRVSHVLWRAGRKELASVMQSRTSEVFAVDIHPGAKIGRGLMIDHATGLVIGETAVVGEHCSFLHGVTLGATGKDAGDRHPKLGNNVAIGCNASIIGNIRLGNNVKVGSGSVVIKPVPDNCTAVGSPARIIFPKDPPSSSAVKSSEATTAPSTSQLPDHNIAAPSSQPKSKPDVVTQTASLIPPLVACNDQPNTHSHSSSSSSQPTAVHSHKCDVLNHDLINILRLIDFGNLPENLIYFIMPIFLCYTLVGAGGSP